MRIALRGFTLLPVVLAMSLLGAVAFMMNRANGLNANQISARSDLARAHYAAEAGLQAVNYAVQALGCAGGYPIASSPVTDSGFAGAAYTAHASDANGSPLTLTSTGSYNGASVTLTRANAYAFQPGLRVWVTQPGPGTGKETYVRRISNAKNYGGSERLLLDITEGAEILVQFDLSPLPPGSRAAVYYDATSSYRPASSISLYNSSASARRGFLLRLVTRSWLAGTQNGGEPANGATWNTYDGVNSWPAPGVGYDPRPLAIVPEDYTAWVDIDATTATMAWMSGVYPNYGVWLDPGSALPADDYDFYSSDYLSNPSLRPKLTVYYLLPCGASAPP